jgi:diguanylate cyclase (GGDEF)-like protein
LKNLHLKFILVFTGLGIICSMSMSILIFFRYKKYINTSVENTLRNAGILVESQMPILGDVGYIRHEGIAESEAYMDILKELQKYCDAFGFTFIYLVENSAEGFVFLLDTDKLNKNIDNTFLKTYDYLTNYFPEITQKQETVISGIYADEYGTFISAFVPVIRNNEIVSIIGLDYEVSLIHTLERSVVVDIVISLIISISIVGIITVWVSNTFANFIQKIDELNKHLVSVNKKLEELSTIDELTKLNNRRSLMEYMDIVWKQNHRLNLPITVLMIDVDYFKKYNDSLGHLEGDKALVAIARCMKNHVRRKTDFVARFGGEEFVCLLPFVKKDEAANFAKTLVENVEKMKIPHPMSEHSQYLTISAGTASIVPNDNNSQTQLLDEADKALYIAKKLGRNRVVVS